MVWIFLNEECCSRVITEGDSILISWSAHLQSAVCPAIELGCLQKTSARRVCLPNGLYHFSPLRVFLCITGSVWPRVPLPWRYRWNNRVQTPASAPWCLRRVTNVSLRSSHPCWLIHSTRTTLDYIRWFYIRACVSFILKCVWT